MADYKQLKLYGYARVSTHCKGDLCNYRGQSAFYRKLKEMEKDNL